VKHWRIAAVDDGLARELARQAALPYPIALVLAARGITTPDGIDRFLKPRLSELSDPFELPDAAAAVDRIWRAIETGEPIAVYGDYDVDGVTGTALMVTVLGALGARVSACLPNRIDEGYGLTPESLARCLEAHHPRLIVTVDCGTGSHAAVAIAREAGVDVVVTDHHPLSGPPAAAVAVVNPKCGTHPHQRMLAGVGVAFKLCHALLKAGRERGHAASTALDLRDHLDLVALGTIADVVPVLGENRILIRHGLACLNGKSRVGLRALAEVAGASGELGAYHVGFVLGPRLNAAGRLGNAELALDLLLTGDEDHAEAVASTLDAANQERKRIEAHILETAMQRIDAGFDPARHFAVVVGEDGWHVGVVGIVAARLAARYSRPAVVVGFDETGMGRGSCRGVDGIDLAATLALCTRHLHKHGGHEKAAGLELHRREFESFQQAFHDACATALSGRDLRPELRVDAWVTMAEMIAPAFFSALTQLAPFGEQNPEPVWAVRGVRVVGLPRKVGTGHLKLAFGEGAHRVEAIGFGMADRPLPEGPMDVAFMVRKNVYLGRETLQWQLVDFRGAGDGT
jgi:single-stranded-DNA-specific exonuclease